MCSLHSKLSFQFHFKGLSVFPLEFVLAVVATVTEGGGWGSGKDHKGVYLVFVLEGCGNWRGQPVGAA